MNDGTITRGFLQRLESLAGCNAIIVGGHGELARALGAALADRGANVVFAARKQTACVDLAREISDVFGVKTAGVRCDISDEASVSSMVDNVVNDFGSIDILVNNAGASWSGAPEDIPLTGWQKIIDVNLTGAFVAARQVARHMIKQGKGSILFIASTGAFSSFTPDLAQIVPYTTSKAGVVHLARDLAAQWAEKGIRVNAIAPGQIRSGLTMTVPEDRLEVVREGIPMKRLGNPEEFAGAVAYLVSDAASYVTGQTLIIDGGLTLS
ncbi:SDR family oxidoreductase [Parahaliea maris]|uniref:SDR family oxidoreductase n=2 Tax=Parahaliea maris TaxID=2716870 RepID=A0A5C9A731_9GAMM|nr:SDR family oxidoreductase [Parahaliea maris]